jgi:CheY-like chemotaxis protein
MAEGLQEEVFGTTSSAQIKALQTIERSSSHLLELINDILDVAKIESGQMTLDCAPTSVVSLCKSSVTFIKQQAHKKGIQLEIKLPVTLPDLFVDERRVRQVLINLLNNAVKFTPESGRVSLEGIQLYTEADTPDTQRFFQFAVKDTGIGISQEHIKQLFQPFVQIDSALNRQYMGTGLGLALVKRIVELHGGRVGLTSEIGVGSCFTVELPCIHAAQIHLNPPKELQSINNAELEPKVLPVILLAEDNEANIITITSYLVAKGYQVFSAKNGQEAVKMAQLHRPNLILMDIQMPIIDGLQAIHEIRLNPQLSHTIIIALTALAMPGDQERCLEAGANDYMCKPVKLKQLTTTIQQFLHQKGQQL